MRAERWQKSEVGEVPVARRKERRRRPLSRSVPEAIGRHEAGHAVLAVKHRVPFVAAWVGVSDRASGGIEIGEPHGGLNLHEALTDTREDRWIRLISNHLIIGLAGAAVACGALSSTIDALA
jgi:hypothetical protein